MRQRFFRVSSTRALGCVLGAWCLGVNVSSQGARDGRESDAAVRQALDAGAYVEAEARAEAHRSEAEARFGPQSVESAQAIDLLVKARLGNGKAREPESLTLAERALSLKEARLGLRHPGLIASLHNLGDLHEQRGQMGEALDLSERALAIQLESPDREGSAVADTLDRVARTLVGLGRFPEARRRLDEALSVRSRTDSAQTVGLARTLEVVGLLYRQWGRFREANEPLAQAIAIRSRLGPEHPAMAATLQLQGDVLFLLGDVHAARDAWTRAFALAERTLGPMHRSIPEMLRRIGLAEYSLGDLGEARRRREEAVRIGETTLARCSPDRVSLQNALAVSLHSDGAYSDARRLYQSALTTIESCGSAGGADVMADARATTLFNAAALAKDLGELQEADRLLNRAVQVWSKGLRPDHPFVARGLEALAEVAAMRGLLARAFALHEDVLLRRRRDLGPDHPLVAWTLTSLAEASADLGRMGRARQYLNDAMAIYGKSGASDEPDRFARLLDLRGALSARDGDWGSARMSLAEALSARERIFGRSHPAVAETRVALAAVDFELGETASVLALSLEAERVGREHLQFTARYLPERQALAYASKRPRGLDLALSTVGQSDVNLAAIFEVAIRSRGVVLDEFVARSRSRSLVDPESAALHATVDGARQRFANLVVRSLSEAVPRVLLDQARSEKEEAERALAEQSASARAELARASAGLTEVRRALPSGAALVSFVRYAQRPANGQRPLGPKQEPAAAYVAFMLVGDQSPIAIQLGEASTIDGLVARWRRDVKSEAGQRSRARGVVARASRASGAALRALVWDPLIRQLGSPRQVFVVPDGSLSLVPITALPTGEAAYVLEEGPVIHYLSSERDLLVEPLDRLLRAGGLLALGGPAFDDRALRGSESTGAGREPSSVLRLPDTAAARSAMCGTFADTRFRHLEGATQEVRDVAALWSSPTASSGNARVLVGREASESAFKREAPIHRILHLATHGFFLGSECVPTGSATRAVGGLVSSSSRPARDVEVESPLLLSGLALAGANRRASARVDEDDGILTAEEVASLNLEGVEWAVLSACDTGVGEVRAGEGVFGLRRAFHVAGVRTIIMSLWSVDDQAARAWMRALYEGRFQRHLSTADAVHAASLATLQARRANGQSTHPFYWAAFVAAGDWR